MPSKDNTTSSASKTSSLNVEDSLKQLEKIIHAMESGSLTLEQTIEHFSQGKVLIQQCQNSINKAKQTVKILMHDSKDTLEDYHHDDQ